jgi:ABC-type multidrug transport system ATPase subunit/pSer/pThr/pTyr-binding forkhead associated (FHA) protein
VASGSRHGTQDPPADDTSRQEASVADLQADARPIHYRLDEQNGQTKQQPADRQPTLVVITYEGDGPQRTECRLSRPVTTIGRDPKNRLVIDSPTIPPFLAELRFDGAQDPNPTIVAVDRSSALYHHGEKITEQRLSPGDIVRVGDPNGSVVTLAYAGGSVPAAPAGPPGQTIALSGTQSLGIGRAPDNQIVLDHPLVSKYHARLTRSPRGEVRITDLGSTNATYVNGYHISSTVLQPGAQVRIGPYRFVYTGPELVQYDEAKSVRIDALDLRETVHAGPLVGGIRKILLDDVSLTILPGSFVAVVGASGSGKTTLLNALNGQRPADQGTVLYNEQDFYHRTASFGTVFGYVPQDDIIHSNLTVERALYYAARMRLPRDYTGRQVWQRIQQVLDDVEMVPQRKQLISQLSGGQRKRVSIGVELLADPPLFFLDEPTSGLDPGLDRKMMLLLRRLADRGHTIVLSTHATANINVCDYVCFLAPGGRLAYFGPPGALRGFFGMNDYAEIYNAIDGEPDRWVAHFRQSSDYMRYVASPRLQTEARVHANDEPESSALLRPRRRNPARQFVLLSQRYVELMVHDRMNLLILLLQAPVIALLTVVLTKQNILQHVGSVAGLANPQDMDAQATLFIMVCSAIWFGTINSAREIVKEEPIYRRERAVTVRVGPYVMSKVVVLGVLCAIQSFLLLYIVTMKSGYPSHGILFAGAHGAFAEMYISLLLMSFVGLMLGLLISALAPNTDRAVSIVPIVLIPQIIFANVIFILSGTGGKIISYLMPARWGMQALGSVVGLHDHFTDHLNEPFYSASKTHLLGFWLALMCQAVILGILTLWLQKRKDVLVDD